MARPGRKRKIAKREPNGRVQRDFRDIEKEKIMAPMIEARARVHRLAPEIARDPKAETAIGRWCLRGEISNAQWQAADRYAKDARAHSMAVQSPRGPGSVLAEGFGGYVGEETEFEAKRASAARQRYADAMTVIVGCELQHSGVSDALAAVVLQDYDLPDVVGLVRIGLNALAHHYGIPVGKDDAA